MATEESMTETEMKEEKAKPEKTYLEYLTEMAKSSEPRDKSEGEKAADLLLEQLIKEGNARSAKNPKVTDSMREDAITQLRIFHAAGAFNPDEEEKRPFVPRSPEGIERIMARYNQEAYELSMEERAEREKRAKEEKEKREKRALEETCSAGEEE